VPYIRLLAEHTSFSESRSESNTLPRDVDLGVLSAALHAVTEGLSVYPQPEGFTPPFNHQMDYPIEKLTARESEVLQLIGHGLNDLFGKHLKRIIPRWPELRIATSLQLFRILLSGRSGERIKLLYQN
jgi:hypothetical protein